MNYTETTLTAQEAAYYYTKGFDHDLDADVDIAEASDFVSAVDKQDVAGVKGLWSRSRLGIADRDLVSPAAGIERFSPPGSTRLNLPLSQIPQGLGTYSMLKAVDYADWVAFFALYRDNDFATVEAIKSIRADWPDAELGPYQSQFMLQDVTIGLQQFSQLYETYMAGVDYMTDPAEFVSIQNGMSPVSSISPVAPAHYLNTPRDMASFVHLDKDQQYLNAAWIMRSLGVNLDKGLIDLWQDDFVNKQMVMVCNLLQRTMQEALRTAWVVKYGNLLCRPEAYAGILQFNTGYFTPSVLSYLQGHPNVIALQAQVGNYLLPMAYPEGSPMHPTYPAGHATTAIACCTMLKILFEQGDFPMPVEIATPTTLQSYSGGDTMTVYGELNKLAANISDARTMAGVHFIDDNRLVSLAEAVAEKVFTDHAAAMGSPFSCSYQNMAGNTVYLGML